MNSLSFGRALILCGLVLGIAVVSYYLGVQSGSAPAVPVIP